MTTRLRRHAAALSGACLVVGLGGIVPAAHAAGTSAIWGRVTGPAGEPVSGTLVIPYREVEADGRTQWRGVGIASTDDDGRYALTKLEPGVYRLRIGWASGLPPTDYATEWYADAATVVSATDIPLGSDQTLTDVDAQLAHDGEISGTVTDVLGRPRRSVEVLGYVLDGQDWVQASDAALTSDDGTYLLDGLRPGTYRVGFRDLMDPMAEYWSDKGLIANATDIVVGQSLVGGIDAQLVEGEHDGEQPTPPPVVTQPPAFQPPAVTPPVVTPPAVDVPTALAKALAALEVTGKPKVGRTIEVAGLDLDLRTAVTYRFQWSSGTRKIARATRSRLKVSSAMKGTKLSVKVTGTAGSTSKSVKIKVGKVS